MRSSTIRRLGLLAVAGAAAALVAACTPVDTTKLPLGDHVTSTSPTVGKVWSCGTAQEGGGGEDQGTAHGVVQNRESCRAGVRTVGPILLTID